MTTRPSGTLPNLPRPPAPLFAAAVVGWACAAVATPPTPTSVYSRRSVATAADQKPAEERSAEEAARAERMLASSLAMLAQADSFSARLRQKVRVGDRVLVGTGRYVQSGRGEDQRYRFESTLTCDTETFELVEVCDGLFAWTFRHYGTDPPQLERLDVRRVREKLGQLQAPEPVTASPYLGGLQRSFGSLRQWFRFVSAEPAEIDGLPVWVVEGRWNPDWLHVILPDVSAAARRPGGITPADLPDGVPWSVRIVVGKSDLLVRRVEWLAIPGTRPVGERPVEPIAVLDLFDIQVDGPIDAAAFFYQPATTGLIDLTEEHLKRLAPMRP